MGGWVTIDNRSGKKYENAKVKLIAGDVNTVSSKATPNYKTARAVPEMAFARNDAPPTFS
jgi:hypothetical protein